MSTAGALERVRSLFREAPFIFHLGIELHDLGPGWAETVLTVAPEHAQAEGLVHAGVQATLADHTAGAAASTRVGDAEVVLSVEFKINLLRAARGERLRCRADVLRPGRTLSVVEARVYAERGEERALTAVALVTLAVVPDPRGTGESS